MAKGIRGELKKRSIKLIKEIEEQEKQMRKLYGPEVVSIEQVAIDFLVQKVAGLELVVEDLSMRIIKLSHERKAQ
jgi:hypothetical protein